MPIGKDQRMVPFIRLVKGNVLMKLKFHSYLMLSHGVASRMYLMDSYQERTVLIQIVYTTRNNNERK